MLATAFEQMAERAKKKMMEIQRAFIEEICQSFGVCKVGASCTGLIIHIVTDEPDKLTDKVDIIAEAWKKAFGEKVIVLITGVDFWIG